MAFPSSILVPIDFLQKSENAIRYACEIAQYTDASIHFLHVVEEPQDFASRVSGAADSLKKERAEQLRELIYDLHSVDDFRSIKMRGQVTVGQIEQTILNVADNQNSDLIVIALGGKTDFKKVMYGSITNNILLESDIPVLAISKSIDYRPPKNLIFTTDLRDGDIQPIKKMKHFSIEIGARLQMVHINKKGDGFDDTLLQRFLEKNRNSLNDESQNIEVHPGNSFTEGIISLIDGSRETILVMTRYKRSFFEWLFSNSKARNVAKLADVPLLMIPKD